MNHPNSIKTPRTPVFHIPHAGDGMPQELMESVCISPEEFQAYHVKMKDSGAEFLINRKTCPAQVLIGFGISRLLCDVERFIGPEEVMERYGMGFCYEKVYDGKQIKNITSELREKTLKYYTAHHEKLDRAVSGLSRVILFDLHSFSEELVMPDRRDSRPMPDICIGADSTYTPPALADAASELFRKAGFSVAVNYPYAGSMVPNIVMKGGTDCDLITMMIEMNRTAVFDENRMLITGRIDLIRNIMDRLTDMSQYM